MIPMAVKTNASQATAVLIADMGISIPPSGGSESLTEFRSVSRAQQSTDLRALLIDDAYGVGSSTLILSNGTDIDQDYASDYLDAAVLFNSGGPFAILTAEAAGDFDAMLYRILNLGAPVGPNDAARLVDATAGGAPWREDEFTATGGQITFIISWPATDANSIELYVNGVLYDDTADYTVSGTTVTWLNTPFSMDVGDKVLVRYI